MIKEAIKAKAKVEPLRKVAPQQGMLTLKMDGVVEVLQGVTDLGQVMRVCIE